MEKVQAKTKGKAEVNVEATMVVRDHRKGHLGNLHKVPVAGTINAVKATGAHWRLSWDGEDISILFEGTSMPELVDILVNAKIIK